MNMDLRKYLRVYKGYYTQKTCGEILTAIQESEWQQHEYYNANSKLRETHDQDLSVTYGNAPCIQSFNDSLWGVVNTYLNKDMNHLGEWWGGWTGYSYARFNRYIPGKYMKLHCDHIYELFEGARRGIPILTILGALNDDYTGGELYFWKDQAIELKAGDVMVFPSNFLYPHEVKEVLTGIRYSYVSWVW